MRIWSFHPRYLDTKGLVALWRETLLAQNVLAGNTKGYKNHPQLKRFKAASDPLGAIASYLQIVAQEATYRGYNFDTFKIKGNPCDVKINLTNGQLVFEREHLLKKLALRDKERYEKLRNIEKFEPHPLFKIIQGEIEPWEVI